MKKRSLLLSAALLMCFCTILKAQDEDVELTKIVFSPDPAYVDIDGKTELNPVFITKNDTVRVKPEMIESWLLDGNPDPEHIIVNGSSYYYSPKGRMPDSNPVTISAVLKNEKNETKFTIVTHVHVTENESYFSLSSINGSTRQFKIESKSFTTGGINAGTTMAFYSKGNDLTACTLTDLKTNIGVSISFSGNRKGNFTFSKSNAIGISMGNSSCGSGDENGNPTEGTIEVVEYGPIGGKIKININGIVNTGNAVSYLLNGTFYVTRNVDVN